MKPTYTCFYLSLIGLGSTTTTALSQTVPADFFGPNYLVSTDATGLIALNTDTVPGNATNNSSTVDWVHGVSGATGIDLSVTIVDVARVEYTSYIQTTGSELIFGRGQEVSILNTELLGNLLTGVTGLSILSTWESVATLDMPMTAGQEYTLTFTTTPGASVLGINNLLGLSNVEIGNTSVGTFETIDLLSLVDIDLLASTHQISIPFTPTSDVESVDITFSAETLADVQLLNDNSGDQDILSFSSMEITPIPEPSAAALFGLGALCTLRRTRKA
ncbi:MAG: PEP-CTERM sorting domain-containing protein [Verrucomicrobiota bacterium JB023]|nr:PEP-CTERM sorting domain-containing protein [Verrucomicrobiota bacterium JB023]